MTATLSSLVESLGTIAPLALAESWDKVGLLVEGDGRAVSRVLLAIDLEPAVLDEARRSGADLVVAYHPLLFKPLDRLDGATWQGRVAIDAIRAGIAVYSPHTALDAALGGVNDWLIDTIDPNASEVRALVPAGGAIEHTHKLVTFVPESSVDELRTALAEANAGVIGAYTHCSFAAEGHGTFFGQDGSNPRVGTAGRLERVREVRFEMGFASRDIGSVVDALRRVHPYEEPAFDLVMLAPKPRDPRVGAGRVARLSAPVEAAALAVRLSASLGCEALERSRSGAGGAVRHERVAVCAGSGGGLLDQAAAAGATLFLTGELSHHDTLRAHRLGIEVLLAGHTNTERGYLPRLADALGALHPTVEVVQSEADRHPLTRAPA